MRRNNRLNLIYGLIAVLLFMATGYAIFSQTLRISGTANTSGTFDVSFVTTNIIGTVGCMPTALISNDRDSLVINVADLAYPGAGTQIDVTIRNSGTIPALLQTVNISGNNDSDITLSLQNVPSNIVLQAGDTKTFSVIVKWAESSTLTTAKSLTFSVDLVYVQSTKSFGQ